VSGHAVALPRNVMNWRRCMVQPRNAPRLIPSLALCDGVARKKGEIIGPDAATRCPR
jgi:hypothetical protein